MIFAVLYIIIAIALFTATIFASGKNINWFGFSIASFVMIVAVLIDRQLKKRAIEKKQNEEFSSDILLEKLIGLLDLCENYKTNLTFEDKEKIEEIFADAIPDIDSSRFALINELNIENYTSIISIYANAERKINRGVSAALDGYISAAKESFSKAINILTDCINELKRVKSE